MSEHETQPLKDSETLRREAVEIVKRRHRGLPAYRGKGVPVAASNQSDRAQKLLKESQQLFTEEKLAQAMMHGDTIVGLAKKGSGVWCDGMTLRGQIFLKQRNFQSARDAFRRTLDYNPAHQRARLALADSYFRTGQHVQAIQWYVETIPLIKDPDERAKHHLALAECYVANKQPEAARRVLKLAERRTANDAGDMVKVLTTLLIPDGVVAWAVIAIAFLLCLVIAVQVGTAAGLIAFVGSVAAYLLIQWLRTPTRTARQDNTG